MADYQDSDLLGDSGKVDAAPLGEDLMIFIHNNMCTCTIHEFEVTIIIIPCFMKTYQLQPCSQASAHAAFLIN